jgi:hypothetical protein
VSYSSTDTDDSEDSLDLGADNRSKVRIAGDGRATQRMKAGPGGGKSSEILNSDVETEPIEEYPPHARKKGKVQTVIRNIERKGAPKLQLSSDYPLDLLPPADLKSKVGFLAEAEGFRLTRLSPNAEKVYPLNHEAHAIYKPFERRGESFACLTPDGLGARYRTPSTTVPAFLGLGDGAGRPDSQGYVCQRTSRAQDRYEKRDTKFASESPQPGILPKFLNAVRP